MLAIFALTAIFGVGMLADMVNGYDLPTPEEEDGEETPEDIGADAGYMPSQEQMSSALDVLALTDGDDTFEGADGTDTVVGGDGNDVLRGGNGVDWLDGEGGNDTVVGGASSDALSGGTGDDYILGGAGEDAVTGGAGNDTIGLGENNDIYDGVGAVSLGFEDGGDDLVRGGAGNDFLRDYDGADTLLGGTGNDTIIGAHAGTGDALADVLHGGFGDDILVGDHGDTMEGGDGVDAFTVDFEFDDTWDVVTITDFDAAQETLTFSASDFGPDAVMEWEAQFDAGTGQVTILLSGSHTVYGSLVQLDQEPAAVLENMAAEDVALLRVTLDLTS